MPTSPALKRWRQGDREFKSMPLDLVFVSINKQNETKQKTSLQVTL
jgi:hypothetical protein